MVRRPCFVGQRGCKSRSWINWRQHRHDGEGETTATLAALKTDAGSVCFMKLHFISAPTSSAHPSTNTTRPYPIDPYLKKYIFMILDTKIYIYIIQFLHADRISLTPPRSRHWTLRKLLWRKIVALMSACSGRNYNFRCINVVFWRVFARDSAPGG